MAVKRVLVPVADGTEEIEAVTVVDVLVRAGASVTVASVGERQVTASRGVKLVADTGIADCVDEDWDLVALPGGIPGAEHLRDSSDLRRLLARHAAEGRLLAAICAAPAVVLEQQGLIGGRAATCHPAFVGHLSDPSAAGARVVVDRALVTSQGPGTAMEWALQLVALLFGEEKARQVAGPMLVAGWPA